MSARWLTLVRRYLLPWALTGLILQVAFLWAVNDWLISRHNHVTVKTVGVRVEPIQVATGRMMALSYDGQYYAAADLHRLRIWKVGQRAPVLDQPFKEDILYLQWLPDRDQLIYAVSSWDKEVYFPKPAYEDLHEDPQEDTHKAPVTVGNKSATPQPAKPTKPIVREGYRVKFLSWAPDAVGSGNVVARLPLQPQKVQIKDISLSTLSNLVEVLLALPGQTKLYQVDIMNNVRELALPYGADIQRVSIDPVQSTLYVAGQARKQGRVWERKGWRWEELPAGLNSLTFLGLDAKGAPMAVASSGPDMRVLRWDGKTWELLALAKDAPLPALWLLADGGDPLVLHWPSPDQMSLWKQGAWQSRTAPTGEWIPGLHDLATVATDGTLTVVPYDRATKGK